ncbi:MAG: hypothetical protein ABIN95_02410 [Mucilaginibacter sp.]
MLKSVAILLFCSYFLLGKMLLPQGDFSLMADLPAMYQQYKAIEEPEDIGVLDFVVDYLLNGEALEQHSKNEKPIPFASVQFQHEANPLSFIVLYYNLQIPQVQFFTISHFIKNDVINTPAHYNKLFRPPLS